MDPHVLTIKLVEIYKRSNWYFHFNTDFYRFPSVPIFWTENRNIWAQHVLEKMWSKAASFIVSSIKGKLILLFPKLSLEATST